MIAGLEDITDGEVMIGGEVVNDVPPKDRNIAMVFQNYALYPHMTVYENMSFGLRLKRVAKDEIARRVENAARILDIGELLQRKPKQLSGGQRQRVAMSPMEAAKSAMADVGGPVIAIALVLAAVFVPVAFLGGLTGQLYKQFALTLAISVILSAICALTFTPAMCALLLERVEEERAPRGPLARFFRGFNRGFERSRAGYVRSLASMGRVQFEVPGYSNACAPIPVDVCRLHLKSRR